MKKTTRAIAIVFSSLAICLVSLVAPLPASAQAQQAAEADAASWAKRCLKREDKMFCEISYGRLLKGRDGQSRWVATTGIQEIEGGPQRDFFIFVPLGVRLRGGMLYRIDASDPLRVEYSVCIPRGCQAVVQASDDLIASFKRGNEILLQFVKANGETVGGKVSLAGFTAAYDGPATETRDVSAAAPTAGAQSGGGGTGGKGDAPVSGN